MENASLPNDAWKNVTSSSPEDDGLHLHLANIRDLALKVIYIVIGTIGVVDNLFVFIIFVLFIKITNKVLTVSQTSCSCVIVSCAASTSHILPTAYASCLFLLCLFVCYRCFLSVIQLLYRPTDIRPLGHKDVNTVNQLIESDWLIYDEPCSRCGIWLIAIHHSRRQIGLMISSLFYLSVCLSVWLSVCLCLSLSTATAAF